MQGTNVQYQPIQGTNVQYQLIQGTFSLSGCMSMGHHEILLQPTILVRTTDECDPASDWRTVECSADLWLPRSADDLVCGDLRVKLALLKDVNSHVVIPG